MDMDIRIHSGRTTPEETAALIVVLLMRTAPKETADRRKSVTDVTWGRDMYDSPRSWHGGQRRP